MRKKDKKLNSKLDTSKGGYVFLGIILFMFAAVVFIEQLRHYNERKAERIGVENICTIIELNSQKTLFAKYSYKVNGKIFYSQRAAPFDDIYPGEMFKVKYLKNKPEINKILFEYPVILEKQDQTRGYIDKIVNNKKAKFHYEFNNIRYNRWQLLRKNHYLTKGDSVDVLITLSNPKIGIIDY